MPSTTTTTTTIITVRSARSSRRRTFLPLSEAIDLTGKLFNPNLKPWRPFRQPINPSLRASQLPPPCAELDERPRRRIRRFMLWQDKVPPLRLVVLDPRKRGHLRRFNVFQIPSNPQFTRGIRTWSGDLKTHKSQIHSPTQPIPRTLHRTPTERVVRAVTPTGIVPAQAGGVIAPLSPLAAPLPGVTSAPPTPRLTGVRASHPIPATLRMPAAMGARAVHRIRSTPESRRLERARLLQHLYVLEQQAERRWRMAMAFLVDKMLVFEQDHIAPSNTDEKPVWAKKPDEGAIIQWLGFMSDIRKWGNIWPHLVPAQRGLPEHLMIRPVKGLAEARQKVKEAKRRREEIKRVKIAKINAMREAKAAALSESADGGACMARVNKGAGPTMVIPRKALPVLRVANLTPAPSLQQWRYSSSNTQRSSSDSSASTSERIVTPRLSTAVSPTYSQTSTILEPTPTRLREMGLKPDIPDEIAHRLAEMLTNFQTIGLERAQEEKAEDPFTEISIPKEKESGGRRRRGARHAPKKTPDLEVSVDSDSSGSEVSDGLSIGPVTEKASEVGSWMTGDLNMDEDTRAIMSGAGTDTGSAS